MHLNGPTTSCAPPTKKGDIKGQLYCIVLYFTRPSRATSPQFTTSHTCESVFCVVPEVINQYSTRPRLYRVTWRVTSILSASQRFNEDHTVASILARLRYSRSDKAEAYFMFPLVVAGPSTVIRYN